MLRIEKLDAGHDLSGFDCGVEPLNKYLKQFARQNQKAGAAQTYLAVMDRAVAGYYTLVVGHVEFDDGPERLRKGLARHPVPVMLLARLALNKNLQGRGIGRGLLRDAILRTLQAADIAGLRAILVHAKDDAAAQYYRAFGFQTGFAEPFHLYLLLSDARRSLKAD